MKLQISKYKCGNCENEFRAPQIRSGVYAEFLLRSSSTDGVSYLDAMDDQTYEEVDILLKSNSRLAGMSANVLAKILQKCYGTIACDPDSNGNTFQIGAHPACPFCGSQSMTYWEVVEPPEYLEKNVPPVTHFNWLSMSDNEKAKKVDQVLAGFGY